MSLRNLLGRFHIPSPAFPKHQFLIHATCGWNELEKHHSFSKQYGDAFGWIFLSAQAAIIFGNGTFALAEGSSKTSLENEIALQKVEEGSVVSNEHTIKWRIFTDQGRELFLKKKVEEAESYFLAALSEAKEGFGESDGHVASSCNNLESDELRKSSNSEEINEILKLGLLQYHH